MIKPMKVDYDFLLVLLGFGLLSGFASYFGLSYKTAHKIERALLFGTMVVSGFLAVVFGLIVKGIAPNLGDELLLGFSMLVGFGGLFSISFLFNYALRGYVKTNFGIELKEIEIKDGKLSKKEETK